MSERRRIAVFTSGRQDWGLLRGTVLLLRASSDFEPIVYASGMHLSEAHGRTVDAITADGLAPRALDTMSGASTPASEAAATLRLVAEALLADRPEALVLLGDRSETLAAAHAAVLERVPIVHLHGGEETEGAIDNVMRHAITKLATLHLVSHEAHARRVVQMGEHPDAVHVVGAPGLDNLYRDDLPDRAQLESRLGIPLEPPVVLVTVHPATLDDDPAALVHAIGSAMEQVPATYVVTLPNNDAGGARIREFWQAWGAGRPRVAIVPALGEGAYWALLRTSDAVLGNSSSGILEAPAAGVPVVDVGDRQKGRLRPDSVANVPADVDAIRRALESALQPGARERVRAAEPLFPAGAAAPRIVDALRGWRPEAQPRKSFFEIEMPAETAPSP